MCVCRVFVRYDVYSDEVREVTHVNALQVLTDASRRTSDWNKKRGLLFLRGAPGLRSQDRSLKSTFQTAACNDLPLTGLNNSSGANLSCRSAL